MSTQGFAPLEEPWGGSAAYSSRAHGFPEQMGLWRLSCPIQYHGEVKSMSLPFAAGDSFNQYNAVGVISCDVWGLVTKGCTASFWLSSHALGALTPHSQNSTTRCAKRGHDQRTSRCYNRWARPTHPLSHCSLAPDV